MKRFLLLFVAVCASFYVMSEDSEEVDAVESYSGSCGDNVTFVFETSTGDLILGGFGEMDDFYYSSPWYSYSNFVKTVVVSDSITSIGEYAFYGCTALTSVALPDSITSIGESAFENCASLTSVIIPDSVTYIGDEAFRKCTSLLSVTLGDSIKSIGDYAFFNC